MEFPDSSVESRLQTRSNYATARNYWTTSPSGRATCPRYPPFRISFGRDRQSSALFAPRLGIVRVITINYIRCIEIAVRYTFVRASLRSQNRYKKKKKHRLIYLLTHRGMNIREFSISSFLEGLIDETIKIKLSSPSRFV